MTEQAPAPETKPEPNPAPPEKKAKPAPQAMIPAAPQAIIRPTTLGQVIEFANFISKTDLVPEQFRGNPGSIVAAIVKGSELGLQAMQSLQSICVINGRASMWGDAMLGLIKSKPDFTGLIEDDHDVILKNNKAVCVARRRGCTDVKRTFSVDMAKKANLWTKKGPWSNYPARMLQLRARSFAIRDQWADVLSGLYTAEEAQDIPEVDVTPQELPGDATVKDVLEAIDSAANESELTRVIVAATNLEVDDRVKAKAAYMAKADKLRGVHEGPREGTKKVGEPEIVDTPEEKKAEPEAKEEPEPEPEPEPNPLHDDGKPDWNEPQGKLGSSDW